MNALPDVEGFARELVDALEHLGLSVEQMHPKTVPANGGVNPTSGCSGRSGPAHAHAHRRGEDSTPAWPARRFAPVMIAEAVGNGCHVHLSALRQDEIAIDRRI